MILRYNSICRFPSAFEQLTGLNLNEFGRLLEAISPVYTETERRRHNRPNRQRAIGGGEQMQLSLEDQLILTLIWRRHYPRQDVLGQFFGVSQPTVWRCTERISPLLVETACCRNAAPDPGRKQRQTKGELLENIPELVDIIGYYLDVISF